jgi:hypothetical protein
MDNVTIFRIAGLLVLGVMGFGAFALIRMLWRFGSR